MKKTICLLVLCIILAIGTYINYENRNTLMLYPSSYHFYENCIGKFNYDLGKYSEAKLSFNEYCWNNKWIKCATKTFTSIEKKSNFNMIRNKNDLEIRINNTTCIFENFFLKQESVCLICHTKQRIDSGEIYLLANGYNSNQEKIITYPNSIEKLSGIEDDRMLSVEFILD